ncbi:hypothetical protein HY450_01150 [Candidatus Pacearchaeota archaeon]|nr:hypothetical protein [Candidatus Pacearchaeota archaeon]
MKFKEGDVVFCKVEKIEGTTVFLEVEGTDKGTMVLSEVAAGRIRNLRSYVSPNRNVVCKILKVVRGHLELSLRRVTSKERDEVLNRHKKGRALRSVFEAVGVGKDELRKIEDLYNLGELMEEAEESPGVLDKLIGKEKAKKVLEMISEKEGREKIAEGKFVLSSLSEQGVNDIKKILDLRDVEIHYLGSSQFSVLSSGKDFKEANNKLNNALEEIGRRAKANNAFFELVKGK